MKIETVNITPAMAGKFLLANHRNRTLVENRVNILSEMIVRGEWQFNGSPIVFDKNGLLIDGQHRLAAIHRADIACETVVVCGLDSSTQLTIDSGRPRTLTDQLVLMGVPSAKDVAALLSRIHFWEITMREDNQFTFLTNQSRNPGTIKQLLELLDQIGQAELLECIAGASRVTNNLKMPKGEIAHSYFMFRAIDGDDAEDFMDLLASGNGLREGHPIFTLRRSIQKESLQSLRPKRNVHRALLIKTWNFYRDGIVVQRITWRPGGAKPEAYPIPR